MKVEKKQIELHCIEVRGEDYGCEMIGCRRPEFTYTFKSDKYYDIERLSFFIDVDVAETLKEFRELKGMSKSELVEWLNENFQK